MLMDLESVGYTPVIQYFINSTVTILRKLIYVQNKNRKPVF